MDGKFPIFSLTTDTAVFSFVGGELKILLIKRKYDPFAECWALPGGFVEQEEEILPAAKRELEEETGITGVDLHEFGSFGRAGRDPRGRTVSIVFYTFIEPEKHNIQAQDDAKEFGWFCLKELPPLAFDHAEVIFAAVEDLKRKFHFSLGIKNILPDDFTISRICDIYDYIT